MGYFDSSGSLKSKLVGTLNEHLTRSLERHSARTGSLLENATLEKPNLYFTMPVEQDNTTDCGIYWIEACKHIIKEHVISKERLESICIPWINCNAARGRMHQGLSAYSQGRLDQEGGAKRNAEHEHIRANKRARPTAENEPEAILVGDNNDGNDKV